MSDLHPAITELSKGRNWKEITIIQKGWSDDSKFQIVDIKGSKFLLRVSAGSEYARRKADYERLERLSGLGIPIPIPIEFGVCSDRQNVYMVLSWVDGIDAEEQLPKMTDEDQHKLGRQAGEVLRSIHTQKVLEQHDAWGCRYTKKIERVIDWYSNCPKQLEYGKEVIDYLQANTHLLNDREITLQHGDYHLGSFVVTDNGKLGVIDFNRSSIGDPWEEYDRYVFTWRISCGFANGQIDGYFNGTVPDKFFRLMALYNATNMLASIPWAIPFGKKEVETMTGNADLVYNSYNRFTTHIPDWYRKRDDA
jgi:aminoglycoside phosphotransferase (APT) family kinase protein